jgi:hypothetical protein
LGQNRGRGGIFFTRSSQILDIADSKPLESAQLDAAANVPGLKIEN